MAQTSEENAPQSAQDKLSSEKQSSAHVPNHPSAQSNSSGAAPSTLSKLDALSEPEHEADIQPASKKFEQNGGNVSHKAKKMPRWAQLPPTYRSHEVAQIAQWIKSGVSGCVVGLSESGRSNLLAFLCNRGEVLEPHLAGKSGGQYAGQPGEHPSGARSITIIPVDIFNLPANDLSNLYRTILHAFYWQRDQIEPALHQYATELYLENRSSQDPFLPQMALYDLLRAFEDADQRVVLILNRFDRFCATATPQMLNTLRGLRDTFRGTLLYIVGMLQEAIYLADEVQLGDMYDILDRHVCWVGDMTVDDADAMFFRDVLPDPQFPISDDSIASILRLSGRFPGLLKTIGFWWLDQDRQSATPNPSEGLAFTQLHDALLSENSMFFRLERLWNCLTQEEQLALSEVQKLELSLPQEYDPLVWIREEIRRKRENGTIDPDARNGALADTRYVPDEPISKSLSKPLSKAVKRQLSDLTEKHGYTLARLAIKGLCQKIGPTWWINSSLLSAYVATKEGRARGRIWLDEQTKQIHQGQQIIQDLPGLQHAILSFMVQNPHARHTNDEIINNAWPDEDQREGISDNALQVHIRSIRKRLEPNPAKPNYLVTWRGNPGGYIFYPEGKPD